MKLKDDWIYWACQVAGWGSYSAATFAAAITFGGWRADLVVGFGLFFLYSVALTHFLRWYIRRREWLLLPARSGLPRAFGSAVVIGGFQTLLVVAIARALMGANAFDTMATVSAATGIVFMTCAWTAIYVAVHWYRGYRQSQIRE